MGTEDDFRLSGLVSCYGIGTRSYNRSAEKREMDRQRKAATKAWSNGPREQVEDVLVCRCRSFHYPHRLAAHNRLRNDWDWRLPEERLRND